MGFWQWLYGGIAGNRDGLMFALAFLFVLAVITASLIGAFFIGFFLYPFIGAFAIIPAGSLFILAVLWIIYYGVETDSWFSDAF